MTISSGNTKLGKIPNISLPPVKTCRKDVPCKETCYAKKFLYRTTVEAAWFGNLYTWQMNPELYFRYIHEFLKRSKPLYFRFHVGGDIPSAHYFKEMLELARDHKNVHFLCITKRWDITQSVLDGCTVPLNMHLRFSCWPGWELPPSGTPRSWMQDGTESRVPDSAIQCSGSCDSCLVCFTHTTSDVVFHKH